MRRALLAVPAAATALAIALLACNTSSGGAGTTDATSDGAPPPDVAADASSESLDDGGAGTTDATRDGACEDVSAPDVSYDEQASVALGDGWCGDWPTATLDQFPACADAGGCCVQALRPAFPPQSYCISQACSAGEVCTLVPEPGPVGARVACVPADACHAGVPCGPIQCAPGLQCLSPGICMNKWMSYP